MVEASGMTVRYGQKVLKVTDLDAMYQARSANIRITYSYYSAISTIVVAAEGWADGQNSVLQAL
jgi:mRNA-degrading endonuclease RelE of RelBE toxin-antitoxin system